MPTLEQLQALLEKTPDDAFLNFGVAMELAKQQQFDASLRRFDRVLKLDPDYVAAHFHKGKTLLAMGDEAAAKAELARGIERAAATGDLHAKGEMEELLATL